MRGPGRWWIGLMVWVVACAGCATSSLRKAEPTPEERYGQALNLLQKGKYEQAVGAFQTLVYSFPGSEIVDKAQYGLAESYFGLKDYLSAGMEYQQVVDHYPSSPLADDAQFKVALCYFKQSPQPALDQEDTKKALEAFYRFIEDYPDSPLVPEAKERIKACRTKLAEKQYLNAELYLKLKRYDAARLYFEDILTRFPDTKWAMPAQFGMGEALLKQQKWEEALAVFQKVCDSQGDATLKQRALRKIEWIQNMQKKQDEHSGS